METNVRVKFCGMQSMKDIQHCMEADYLGFIVEVPSSKRNLSLENAKSLIHNEMYDFKSVAVTTSINAIPNISATVNPDFIQIHTKIPNPDTLLETLEQENQRFIITIGSSSQQDVNKDLLNHELALKSEFILIESIKNGTISGGSGKMRDYGKTAEIIKENKKLKFTIAGGLNPANIYDIVVKTAPYGIDVSSGIENSNGTKDRNLVEQLLTNIEKYNRIV